MLYITRFKKRVIYNNMEKFHGNLPKLKFKELKNRFLRSNESLFIFIFVFEQMKRYKIKTMKNMIIKRIKRIDNVFQ